MPKRPALAIVPKGASPTVPEADQSLRHNLPAQTTFFVGRERETAQALSLLGREDIRLLTLLGPPGVGKTRLAIHLAGEMLKSRLNFGGSIYFVPFASITDASFVEQVIARVLDVKATTGESLAESLAERLRDEQALLLLDNFEQVLDAAPLISNLLSECAHLKVLTTSRVALRLYGEQEFIVPTLQVPSIQYSGANGAKPSHNWYSTLGNVESVALFVHRARLVRPDFELTEANARAVAEICARSDGLPLAIELAAARTRHLSPQALLSRLEHRLDVLASGPRDLPRRQQTLRQAIEWSYELLSGGEQRLFRVLSCFVGGCTVPAIEAVHGPLPKGKLLEDLVDSLSDKSLVKEQEDEHGSMRYSMLETIREYGLESLKECGESEEFEVRGRHARYYQAFAREAAEQFTGPSPGLWFKRLEEELGNIRVALRWLLDHYDAREDVSAPVSVTTQLYAFWLSGGHITEGIRWLEEELELGERVLPEARAAGALMAGSLAYANGDYERATQHFETTLHFHRQREDRSGIAQALHGLGTVALSEGRYEQAKAALMEASTLYGEAGDKGGVARITNDLGELALRQKDWDTALQYFEECLVLFRDLGWRGGVSIALSNLGDVNRYKGLWDEAGAFYRQSLQLAQELGTQSSTTYVLEGLAGVALGQRLSRRAAHLLGAVERLREVAQRPLDPDKRAEHEQNVERIRNALGEDAFMAAWQAGREMTDDEIVAYAQEAGPLRELNRRSLRAVRAMRTTQGFPALAREAMQSQTKERSTNIDGTDLTTREQEVVALVAQNRSNSEIAERLVVTKRTVETHIGNILAKLGFTSRSQIAIWAIRKGLANPDEAASSI